MKIELNFREKEVVAQEWDPAVTEAAIGPRVENGQNPLTENDPDLGHEQAEVEETDIVGQVGTDTGAVGTKRGGGLRVGVVLGRGVPLWNS